MKEQLTRLFARPEMAVVIFAFLLNFIWEFWQLPYYANAPDMPHWEGTKMCTLATFGDAGIALAAFLAASLVAGTRDWLRDGAEKKTIATFIAVGLAITVGAEWVLADLLGQWSYAEGAPTIFGIGLTPFLQWLVVPVFVILLARPYLRGMQV